MRHATWRRTTLEDVRRLQVNAADDLPGKTGPLTKTPIAEAEKLILSERDSLRMIDLLEHPPAPSERLRRVARAGFILE